MALSDDIRQLIRREQDIQGVIGVLDTYLTDRQKRRDDYKPVKPDLVKITEIDEETGNEITKFVPKSEDTSYVTKLYEPTEEELTQTEDPELEPNPTNIIAGVDFTDDLRRVDELVEEYGIKQKDDK